MNMFKDLKEDMSKFINEICENTNNRMKWRNSSRHEGGNEITKENLNWGKTGKNGNKKKRKF